jgi:hypothetical protein
MPNMLRTWALVSCLATGLMEPGQALANPALAGTWSGTVAGQALSLALDGQGSGRVDGRAIRYQVMGALLLVEDRGEVTAYQFELRGNQLQVAGGDLPGVVNLRRGSASAVPVAPTTVRPDSATGVRPELVGKWCKASSFTANGGGGSQSSACFELRGDGSYTYQSERSASAYGGSGGGMWGGTASNNADAGRWSANDSSISAQSRSGQTSTYRLEKRNHPKNRDPMLCLDGECYVSYWQKPAW